MLPNRKEIERWLNAEKTQLEPKLVGLGHWFHDNEGNGFGVSVTCFFGVSGEFHVTSEGKMSYCLGTYGGDEDEIRELEQLSAWTDVTKRFNEFIEAAERMDDEERGKRVKD